jgi:pyrimidine deaminase RibD-like protein
MDPQLVKVALEAVNQARKCSPENPSKPLVGAVLVEKDGTEHSAYRGQQAPGDHAEFTLLQKRLRSKDLTKDAVLFTTLEPCTTRSHDKKPCAQWIVDKGIKRVFIGILDPNPQICGRGYWHLVRNGVAVDFFPWSLASEIMALNSDFIMHQRRGPYSDALSALIEPRKAAIISRYNLLGWGHSLSVLDSPTLRDGGWPARRIRLEHDATHPFTMPDDYRERYKGYHATNYTAKRFFDDREKFILARNPTAFSDSETLILQTRSARFSELMFYRDWVAANEHERDRLIDDFLRGSLQCHFAHGFNLQLVVATSDRKILLTKRSPKVAFFPDSWSCSLEETLATVDIQADPEHVLEHWFARALDEELGVAKDAFHVDSLRVLSVFLESDYLNLNLCGYTTLNVTSTELERIMKGHPRADTEFVAWRYLPLDQAALLSELVRPSELQHPTTGYRLLMSLLLNFGAPSEREIRRFLQPE